MLTVTLSKHCDLRAVGTLSTSVLPYFRSWQCDERERTTKCYILCTNPHKHVTLNWNFSRAVSVLRVAAVVASLLGRRNFTVIDYFLFAAHTFIAARNHRGDTRDREYLYIYIYTLGWHVYTCLRTAREATRMRETDASIQTIRISFGNDYDVHKYSCAPF